MEPPRDKQGQTRDSQGQTRDSQGQNRDNQGQVAELVKYLAPQLGCFFFGHFDAIQHFF